MKFARRAMIVSLFCVAGCGGGGGGGGGSPPSPPPPPPPTITITAPTSPLTAALVGDLLSNVTFTATGTGPTTWTVTAGSLPPGINLTSGGIYGGTPTTPGTYNFNVTAVNATASVTSGFSHTINPLSIQETEANNTPGTANPLPVRTAGLGSLTTVGDVDYWSFSSTANTVVRFEISGVRRDFATWDGVPNVPRLQVFGSNGTAYLVGHDILNTAGGAVGWQWGFHDVDIPLFRIPATGTYFLRVDCFDTAFAGGEYAVRVVPVDVGSLQFESESNNTSGTANAITPGVISAYHADGEDDWYSFSVTAPAVVSFEMMAYRTGIHGVAGVMDNDYYDPMIQLVAPDGSTVLKTDDDVYFYDSALSFFITTSGTYFLRVTESPLGTDGDAPYFLTFDLQDASTAVAESETGDTTAQATAIAYDDIVTGSLSSLTDLDWYSFTGTAGDMVRVVWYDLNSHQGAVDEVRADFAIDDVTGISEHISFENNFNMNCVRTMLQSSGTVYVVVGAAAAAVGGTNYAFRIELVKASTYETEGNDTTGTAGGLSGAGRAAGMIGASGDQDVFSFTALAGELVTFAIYGATGANSNGFYDFSGNGSILTPILEILDGGGSTVASVPWDGSFLSPEVISNGMASAEVTYRAPSAGTYYVRVTASDGLGDNTHTHMIEKR